MHFFKYSIPVLATLLSFVIADEAAIADPNSAVVKLTADKFESFISENPLVLAEFFAPWCGHCKNLGPEFASAADELDSKNIKLAQIDCTEEADLCKDFGIRGYPTLKVFKGDTTHITDYEGPRKSDGIVSYMLKQALPAVSEFNDSDSLTDFIEEQTEALVLEIVPEKLSVKDEKNATFYNLAKTLKDKYTFASTNAESFVTKYSKSATEPTFLVFRPNDEEPTTYVASEFSEDSLKDFVEVESIPYFGEISQDTYSLYMNSKFPLAYYFYETAEEREAISSALSKLGKEYRGSISFVGLNAKLYGRHAENLNMEQKFPLFAIHDLNSNLKYGLPQTSTPTENEIVEFVEKFVSGDLEPIVKSEDIPTEEEKAQESVLRIVGKNHDEIVNDSTKDVLVKYYAPWCGHCKKLAPIYEDLASLYKNSEFQDKIVIGKVDHTLNDVNVQIAGYPTLILYPANGEIDEATGLKKGIVYSKQRELENIAQFIKENGDNHVDILSASAKSDEIDEDVHDEL